MSFSAEKQLKNALHLLNDLIVSVNDAGGSVHLYYRGDQDFSIKLNHPIEISYFLPLSKDKED